MLLPPGPAYLLQNILSLFGPPAFVWLSANFSSAQGFEVQSWAVALACCLSLPVVLFIRVQYKDFVDHRSAPAQRAVLPPRVYDKWPAGITLLAQMVDNLKNGYPGDMFVEWTEKHGSTLNFRTLFEDRFYTSEPEYIKAVLATQFDKFERGPVFKEQLKTMLGTGVFNSDGEMWKFHRAMTRPFFSKNRISDFEIFDRHATEALSQLKSRLREGFPVDIQDLASRFTMDTATEFLFSKNVHSLLGGLPYPHYSSLVNTIAHDYPSHRFSKAFDQAQQAIALRARRGINWPLAEFWKDRVKEHMVIIHDFVDPVMRAAVERKRELNDANGFGSSADKISVDNPKEVKEGDNLLDHLINYTEDETVLRDEILNILLAGRDTTANSITFAIYMLAEHPDILKRLREEILEKVGSTRCPNIDDIKNMKYLRAVINETIRLYPAAPFNIRTSSEPVILPGKNGSKPFYIPAQSKFLFSLLQMHRRKDLWGPDALDFDPDRFLDQRLKRYLTPNPFIFLPFSAGPRICLGQQFAYHEISFFLIRLLQEFSGISHVYEAQPPGSRPPDAWKGAEGPKGKDKIWMKTYMTMSVMGGCWVAFEPSCQEVGDAGVSFL